MMILLALLAIAVVITFGAVTFGGVSGKGVIGKFGSATFRTARSGTASLKSGGAKFDPFAGPAMQRVKDRRDTARILALDSETLADLQMEIAVVGDVAPTCYQLFPTGYRAPSAANIVLLPRGMRQERLSGKTLRLTTTTAADNAPHVKVELGKAPTGFSQLGGKEFDLVGIPRVADATGKAILRTGPDVWMKRNPRLMDLALEICPRHPQRVFEVLLTHGTVNAAFKWAGAPETFTCEACKTKRQPVMQLWGQALGLGAAAQVYVLACNCAADQFSTVVQIVGQTFV